MSKFIQYESFVATVKTGSVRLAADSLNRTPSAVSKQITHLEHDLGVQLFERSNKQMVLTAHGSSFYKTANSIVRQIGESEKQIKLDSAAIAGEIKITLSKSLIGNRLTAYLNEFSALHPNIQFQLNYSEQVENFAEIDFDFAFRIGAIADSTRLIARQLTDVRPTFYATPDYLQAFGKPNSISELSSHRVAVPPLEDLSAEVRQWLKQNQFSSNTNSHHRVNDVSAIKDMVLQHGCVGLHLHQCIIGLIEKGVVIPLFQDTPLPSKKLHLVYRKATFLSSHIEAFKDFVIEKYLSHV